MQEENSGRPKVHSGNILHHSCADQFRFYTKALWQMCKQNKIVHIKSGNKFLVNVDKFIEFLNTGETEVESNDKESNTA